MLKKVLFIGLILFHGVLFAQIEFPNNNNVRFESSQSTIDNPTGFEIPAVKTPSLTKNNKSNTFSNYDLGKEKA